MLGAMATNILVAGVSALGWQMRHYWAGPSEVAQAQTRPVSDEAYSFSAGAAGEIQRRLGHLTRPEMQPGYRKGKEWDMDRILENQMMVEGGLPPSPKIFRKKKERKMKVNAGLLFSNGVCAREYEGGFPLEAAVQSVFEGADAIERMQTCVMAFDNDAHLIKDFDSRYNATSYGMMPANAGYHAKLGFALEAMADQFGLASMPAKKKVLYVVTRPIFSRKERRKAEQAMEKLREARIGTGVIYLGEAPRQPLGKAYCVLTSSNIGELPNMIGRMNRKL